MQLGKAPCPDVLLAHKACLSGALSIGSGPSNLYHLQASTIAAAAAAAAYA